MSRIACMLDGAVNLVMSGRKYVLGFGVLVATVTTVPAYAQPAPAAGSAAATMATDFPVCTKKVDDSDSELARQKFIAARQDYEEANYDSAVRRFRDAYNLDCTKPELLLIISAAHERKGDRQAALAALEVYVQRAPKDAPDMVTTQAKIENLKKQMAAAPPPPLPTASAPPPAPDNQEHTIYPWLAVGVGAAGIVTGIILFAAKPDLPDNCAESSRTCTGPDGDTKASTKDIEQAQNAVSYPRVGAGFLIGGGVVLVGGLIWHFLEPTGPKTASAKKTNLSPSVAPGFAGLSYGGTF